MPVQILRFLSAALYLLVLIRAQDPNTEEQDSGIDEHEAVIEFDESDDLFKLLLNRESSCIHLYSRQDPQFLAKRKAFRKAAKRDIDQSTKNGAKQIEKKKITQWIAIDKELIGSELNMSLPESEEDVDP